MTRIRGAAAPAPVLPLRRLMLCVDCEVCFEIGGTTCPACGSSIWVPLARFLEAAHSLRKNADVARLPANRRPGARQLLIVAKNRLKLYQYMRRAFQGNETVRVLLDQRAGERRRSSGTTPEAERRKADRRRSVHVDDILRVLGWAIVLQDHPENRRPHSR
ncbi:MAG TPA: hypothetical protein VIE37_00845 [Methylomirabilota bacterium]